MLRRGRCLAMAVAVAVTSSLPARAYYVNQGVKYHLGDGRAGRSVDAQFLDAYPVVGPRWVQAFTVDRPDTVYVRIDRIWGVDDCEYCKDMVYIDDTPMGRLFEENNGKPFNTPSPLSLKVKPGHSYLLRIESFAKGGQRDDWAFEGVSVLTDKAHVTMLEPGPLVLQPEQPLPVFKPPRRVVGPCQGTRPIGAWLPDAYRSYGAMPWALAARPQIRRLAGGLPRDGFARFFVKVDASRPGHSVEQFLELRLGQPGSGWVLSFAGGGLSPFHGNVREKGRYSAASFGVGAWKQGAWNEWMVARCADGAAHLWLNGQLVPVSLDVSGDAMRWRVAGLRCVVAPQPY